MKPAHAIDQDSTIAEYVLGLSPAKDVPHIQELLSRSDPAAACALKWEAYLLGICDSLAPVAPPQDLLVRIQDALGHRTLIAPPAAPATPPVPATAPPQRIEPVLARVSEPIPMQTPASKHTIDPASAPKSEVGATPTAAAKPAPAPPITVEQRATASPSGARRREPTRRPGPWRLIATLLGAAVIALGFFLIKAWSKPDIPAIQIVQVAPTQVAILQAPGLSSTPGWLVTVDTQGTVRLDPQVKTSVQPNEAVELWTRQADGRDSRSLGLVDPNQAVTIPASLIGAVVAGQIFEMTLERKEGSASGKPEGPILFIGQIVTFGVQSPSKPLA